MPYPEKGAKYAGQDRANKIASRAEGGKIEPFPISMAESDARRAAVHNKIKAYADRYGTKAADEVLSRLPKAKLMLHPNAPRCRGGRTRLKTQ